MIQGLSTSVKVACLLVGFMALSLNSQQAHASPWIEADDPYLRASLQQLADAGHLRSNVSTYPLMWYGIAEQMRGIRLATLSDDELFAYHRVRSALEFAQQPNVQRLQLRAASDERIVQGFGVRHREQAALTASRSFTGDYVAGRVQTTLKTSAVDDKSYSFEGSYLATTLGNWAFSVDQLDVWWGPGQDTALVLSSHAMPIQALRVNRLGTQVNSDIAPWLPDLGNLHATAFIGRSQRAGALGDHPVFGARVSWRPIAALELGASYTGQWGGDDYPNDLNRAFSVVALENDDEVGNQIGGVDARLAVMGRLGLYAEVATDNRRFEDPATTFGADFRFSSPERLQEVFIEFTDVPAAFYNDQRDPAGYRRYGMSMGAAQDQDVESWVVGYRRQHSNGTGVTVRLRDMTYGHTNQRIAYDYSLTSGDSIQRRQLDMTYQQALGDSLIKFQLKYADDSLSLASPGRAMNDESGFSGSISWEIRF